jgi:hypothetical protein
MRVLTGARSLTCSFPWYASADWDSDQPRVKTALQDEFGFQSDGIDYSNRTARLIGNAGADDLTASRAISSVSFIEVVPMGSRRVRSIFWRTTLCAVGTRTSLALP